MPYRACKCGLPLPIPFGFSHDGAGKSLTEVCDYSRGMKKGLVAALCSVIIVLVFQWSSSSHGVDDRARDLTLLPSPVLTPAMATALPSGCRASTKGLFFDEFDSGNALDN